MSSSPSAPAYRNGLSRQVVADVGVGAGGEQRPDRLGLLGVRRGHDRCAAGCVAGVDGRALREEAVDGGEVAGGGGLVESQVGHGASGRSGVRGGEAANAETRIAARAASVACPSAPRVAGRAASRSRSPGPAPRRRRRRRRTQEPAVVRSLHGPQRRRRRRASDAVDPVDEGVAGRPASTASRGTSATVEVRVQRGTARDRRQPPARATSRSGAAAGRTPSTCRTSCSTSAYPAAHADHRADPRSPTRRRRRPRSRWRAS